MSRGRRHHQRVALIRPAIRGADRQALGVNVCDRGLGVQANAAPDQPLAEVFQDALREQDATGRREQGEVGALEAKKRQPGGELAG